MTKADLITAISEKSGFTKKDSEKVLAAITDSITGALVSGDKVSLVGFGTFEVRDRAAREGVNPQTGKKITIAATKAPAFKASKTLKDAISK